MLKFIKIALLLLALLAVVAGFVIEYVAPYSPIKPYRQNIQRTNWRMPLGSQPENYGLAADSLRFFSTDSFWMKGWLCKPAFSDSTVAKPLTIIMLHGISSCKEHYFGAAKRLTDRGYNVVLPDLRAHGESGGEFCTFGFREKEDIKILVDSLLVRDSNQQIGIFGHSLGGAVALQCLAHDPRLRFGIIESTFHDFEQVARVYSKNYSGIGSEALVRRVLEKSGRLAAFDPFKIKPFLAAEKITQPIFMAHGDSDERIPIEFGKMNFDHLASTEKEWHTVIGGTHLTMWRRGGNEYIELIFNFLERQKRKN